LIVISTWDAFHGHLRQALEAFAAGDAKPYKGCWSTNNDCTVFGAFGGVVQGATEVRSRLDWAASQYRGGHYAAYDVLAEYVGEDMGCIVALELVESRDAQGAKITRERRITHVARREPGGWCQRRSKTDPLASSEN
jgi:ketosteroid isomerase-like protein